MAETLVAILLVTGSANGSNLIFRWPPSPISSPRFSRSKPGENISEKCQLDNPWRASHLPDFTTDIENKFENLGFESEEEYTWNRPNTTRDTGLSYSPSPQRTSGRNSPSKDPRGDSSASQTSPSEYDRIFDYSSEFLAGLLCPKSSLCYQKFELLVDNLAFIGHPVCAEPDGCWRFTLERIKLNFRGRETRSGRSSHRPSVSPGKRTSENTNTTLQSAWLKSFHLVLVLDRPDPSSSASGNVAKYFHVIYEQVAFIVTAVLFQEQVLSNFVETECELLGPLKDMYISKGEPYEKFSNHALEISSIASAMKSLYEAIKISCIAYITIHDIPLEIQLPPHLDMLLHSEVDESELIHRPDDDETQNWGHDMSIGWNLPLLQPWKGLLLLDAHSSLDPSMILKGLNMDPDERTLVEGLIRFLEIASVTLSLADMASLLDWDLESQVMPTVIWLVQHRRAKVVDLVHAGLKTVFMVASKFPLQLSNLTAEFDTQFSHPFVPSLPDILATISSSVSKQSNNHFFASVVKDKELIPLYHDVVLWLLKRDLLVTLHLHIRIVAPTKLKIRVQVGRQNAFTKRATGSHDRLRDDYKREQGDANNGVDLLLLSGAPPRSHSNIGLNETSCHEFEEKLYMYDNNRFATNFEDGSDDTGWETEEDRLQPSLINDPARATPLQRRWLTAMSDGKEPGIAKRFQRINQYFDGKKTDDEILYRAEISRKQLREVLHQYDEYLQTFLHPS